MDPKTRGPAPPVPAGLVPREGTGMRTSSASNRTVGRAIPTRNAFSTVDKPTKAQPSYVHQTQYQFGQEYQQVSLSKCRKCGRGFSYDRLAYHESVCKGASGSKRKTFNSKNQRLGDFDSFELNGGGGGRKGGRGMGRGVGTTSYSAPAANRTNWRQQHNEFITAIREAKRYAPPPSRNPVAPPPRGAPRAPFQGSVQRNPVTSRHQYQQQNISSHAAMGNGRTRSSGPGGYRGGGGTPMGNNRAFGGDRWAGSGGGYGGGGGGSSGKYNISMSNETSLGMLQAMGRR